MILHNIPKHKNCTNCGICCGPIIVSDNELKMIKQYVSDHPDIKKKSKENLLHVCLEMKNRKNA